MKITKEWKLVIYLSLAIVLLSQLPLIFGYVLEEEGEVFMGIPVHVTDANNHLHWMLQAKEGSVFFTNKFTSEDVPSLIFNPYHLVVGNLSRFTFLPLIFWYHVVSILAIIGFLLYLYHFISYFVKDKQTRLYAFIITSLGAGFGVFWRLSKILFDKWIASSDLWVTDMNVFQSFGHPHFTISMLLILVVFLNGYKALEKNSSKHAIKAGLFGLLLGFIHIFDVVTIAVVLASWFAYKSILAREIDWKRFWKLGIIGGFMSPAVLYYLWIILFNPTYAEWNALNQTITPLPHELISGFGLLFFFAIIAIYQERKQFSFLSVWVIVNLVLVYLPINVQRRFLLGIGIPLGILSAEALKKTILPWLKKRKLKTIGVVAIVALLFSTTVYLTVVSINQLHESETTDYTNVKYLSTFEVEAIRWIDENINNDVIIVAPLRIGNYMPALTNNKVYLGHWAQTIDFNTKKEEISLLYSESPVNIYADLIWYSTPTNKPTAYQNKEISLVYN